MEPLSKAKHSVPLPGPERIVRQGVDFAVHRPHLLARLLGLGGVPANSTRYTGTEVTPMAENKKPAESPKPDRPKDQRFPPPGPERIVKSGAGPSRR